VLIIFEGLDKCGKTTLLNKTKEYLEEQFNLNIIVDTPSNKECLYSDNRTECFYNQIRRVSNLAKNNTDIVILDRYYPSWIVYEAYGDYSKFIKNKNFIIEEIKEDKLIPFNLALFIDRPIEDIEQSLSNEEKAIINNLEEYREQFLHLTTIFPRMKIIDNSGSVHYALELILTYIFDSLSEEKFLNKILNSFFTQHEVRIGVYGYGKTLFMNTLLSFIKQECKRHNLEYSVSKGINYTLETSKHLLTLYGLNTYWNNTIDLDYLIIKSMPTNSKDSELFKTLLGYDYFYQLWELDRLRCIKELSWESYIHFIYISKDGKIGISKLEPHILGRI